MAAVILEPQNIVSHCFQCFPIYLPWSDGTRCHDLSFLNVEFQANFFTLLFPSSRKRLFSSSLLSAIGWCHLCILGYWYFSILIPVCASSSLAFCLMYSEYKLNMQGDNIQPWCTPFPIWNQFAVQCLVLTVPSWPAYRFLRSQIRWSGITISLRTFHIFFFFFRTFHILLWSTQSKSLV